MASPLGRMLPFNLFFFLRSNEKFYDPHFAVLFQYGARSALVNMAGALKFNDGHLMFQIDISFKKNCSASPHSITTRSHFDYVTPDSIWWCQTNDNQHSLQFTFLYLFILVSYLFLFRFNLYFFFSFKCWYLCTLRINSIFQKFKWTFSVASTFPSSFLTLFIEMFCQIFGPNLDEVG